MDSILVHGVTYWWRPEPGREGEFVARFEARVPEEHREWVANRLQASGAGPPGVHLDQCDRPRWKDESTLVFTLPGPVAAGSKAPPKDKPPSTSPFAKLNLRR